MKPFFKSASARIVPLLAGLCLTCLDAQATDPRVLNALLDGVFSSHVKDGYVDYPEIAKNVRFHKYVEALADADLSALTETDDQIAFWLNVYNALAVKNVTDGTTPLTTLGRIKFFRRLEHRVAGKKLDLNSIEDKLADFEQPLIRFALVKASYASPNLRSGAYRGDGLQRQLEEAARDFVNDRRKNRFSSALRQAKLSQLFEWHGGEFGDGDKELLNFIAPYVEKEGITEEIQAGGWKIEYMEFEWSINGRPM